MSFFLGASALLFSVLAEESGEYKKIFLAYVVNYSIFTYSAAVRR